MNRTGTQQNLSIEAEGSLAAILRSRKKALTAEEIADMLSCSTKSIYAMAKANRIPSIRIGSLVRFDPRTTAAWLEAQSVL